MRYYPDLSRIFAWIERSPRRAASKAGNAKLRVPDASAAPAKEVPPMHSLEPGGPRTILMLGSEEGGLMKPAHWLQGQSANLVWPKSFAKARGLLSRRGQFSHLLIDVDDHGGIARLFNTLRRFRDEVPEVPVILFSRDFLVDDLDLDRIWLCDASLRPTATFTTLELALSISEVNNQHWQAKAARMQAEKARTSA